ncbi:MAG TPA: DMT family transporter [Clostridiales bacterium]|nr:DMT family transporter [Clostridiales bacterium]
MNKKKTIGFSCGIISGMSYGFYGIFSSLLLAAGITDLAIIALPPLALTVFFGIKVLFKPRVMKEIPWKIYLLLILQGGIVSTAMNYSYINAYASGMPVGVVSIVAFCNVIVVMILSYFVLSYKFTLPKIIAIVLAVFGVSLVIGVIGGGGNVGTYTALGLMWTLLIPVFYGINVVITAYALTKGTDSDAVLLLAQGSSLIVVLVFLIHPLALFQDLFGHMGGDVLLWLAFLGFCLIPHALSYATMQEALKRIDPTIYQILMSFDPVTSLTLGIIIMSQVVSGLQLLGVALVLAAVIFITVMDGREASRENDAGEIPGAPEEPTLSS